MSPADVCKSVWALATLSPEHSSRVVVAALSHTWLTDHIETASLLDNSQMLWSLGSVYARSNDDISLDTVTALLRRCREQISEGSRNGEDIEKCATALSLSMYYTSCVVVIIGAVCCVATTTLRCLCTPQQCCILEHRHRTAAKRSRDWAACYIRIMHSRLFTECVQY